MVAYTEGKEHPHYALSLDNLECCIWRWGPMRKPSPCFKRPGRSWPRHWARSIPITPKEPQNLAMLDPRDGRFGESRAFASRGRHC